MPIYTQGSTDESGLTLPRLCATEKCKSWNTEQGPSMFDNCKTNNVVKTNNLMNQYVLMKLKDKAACPSVQ